MAFCSEIPTSNVIDLARGPLPATMRVRPLAAALPPRVPKNPAASSPPVAKALTTKERDALALARFEDKFGATSVETQLGKLDDEGKPAGLGKFTRSNMFRVIGGG